MTQTLFREGAYLTECTATVTAITKQGLVLDRTVLYQSATTRRVVLGFAA